MSWKRYTVDSLREPGRNFFPLVAPHGVDATLVAPAAGAERRLVTLALEPVGGGAPPAWLIRPAASRLPLSLAPEPIPGGRVLARVAEGGSPAITVREGQAAFAFDPFVALDDLLHERHVKASRPITSLLPFRYQWIPGRARLWLHGRMATRGARRDPSGFPAWPIEPAAEVLRWLVAAAIAEAGGEAHADGPLLWPAGKRVALALTHDVDTAAGLPPAREMAEIEEGMGLRSCWAVVGRSIERAGDRIERLRLAGHEIALHGDDHDTKLAYSSPGEIERRLDACAEVVERHEIRGFRSPALLTSPALDEAVSRRFAWSSSTIDADLGSPIAPRRGVGTVFPFTKAGLLEIPVTVPFDDRLLVLGIEGDAFVERVLAKIDWIARVGGVAVLANHPEPHLSGSREGMALYRRILTALRARKDVWFALPDEIARHWRAIRGGPDPTGPHSPPRAGAL